MKRVGLIVTKAVQPPASFVCPHCGKEYKSEKTLRDHCKKEHPEAFDDQE